MFSKLKIKLAKEYQAKYVAKLFEAIDKKINYKKALRLIRNKKVYILKDKKRIRAAFSYSIIGIIGIFSIMYIHNIAVAPELQGKGIGTFMLSRIRKNGLKIGASIILLYSIKKAKRFYEKNELNRFWRFFWWKIKKAD